MEQFKTTEDLREYIKTIKNFRARPSPRGVHPTLYITDQDKENPKIHMGVRELDYLFSPDFNWVLDSNEMGLSFSAHWQHLKDMYNYKKRRNKGANIDVYWTFEEADLPSGLAFVPDPTDRKKWHYFLVVTKKMRVSELAGKLQWMADHMAKITDATKVLT